MPSSLVSNIRFHDYQFEYPVPAGKWRWTTRLDVTQSNPIYSVRDVISPYGLLRDSIPIPGEVVQSMSASIDELKANFAPHILMGPPSSLVFNVDQGEGFTSPQSVQVTNDGTYGSVLGVTLTSSAPYVRITPAQVGNLALNESGSFQVSIDSTNLLASASPYSATVTVQDPSALNSPVVYPITINVLPLALVATSVSSLTFAAIKPLSGPFPPVSNQAFAVLNAGPTGSSLDFDIQKLLGTSDWLTAFLPSSGTVASGANQAITVSVTPPDYMLPGTYTETLRISGVSSNGYADVQIQLVIS